MGSDSCSLVAFTGLSIIRNVVTKHFTARRPWWSMPSKVCSVPTKDFVLNGGAKPVSFFISVTVLVQNEVLQNSYLPDKKNAVT